MAVTVEKSYLNELVTGNLTVTTVDYYMKMFIASGLSSDSTITIPTAGGGAKNGTIIHFDNNDATYKFIVSYGSGLSIDLFPGMSIALIWNGSAWVEHIKSNYKGARLILLNDTDYQEKYGAGAGTFETLDNAYYDTGAASYKLKNSGYARRVVTDKATGAEFKYRSNNTSAGAAGDSITWIKDSDRYRGLIKGGLVFNSSSLPPLISSGTYDVLGFGIEYDSNQALALTDTLGAISQTLLDHAYNWIRIVIDKIGRKFWIPSFDNTSIVANGVTVTSIDVTSNVATIYTGDTTGLLSGMIAVVMGSELGLIIGGISNIVSNTSFDVSVNAANGTGYTGGTYDAYYRIQTYHGVGTITGVNTSSDIVKYSPSPKYGVELCGYYLDQYGRPTNVKSDSVYRIIGNASIDSSGNVLNGLISYKSGKEKNDIYIETDSTVVSTLVGSTFRYTIPTRFSKLWGNDYVATDDGTNAFRITASENIDYVSKVVSKVITAGSGNAAANGIYENANVISEHRINVNTATQITSWAPIVSNGILYLNSFLDMRVTVSGTTNQISNLTFRGKLSDI